MASNNGIKGGAYIRLGKEIDRQLLNLACPHHVSEIAHEVSSVHGVSKLKTFGLVSIILYCS